VFKDKKKCFWEVNVDSEKALVFLPFAFEKTHEIVRSNPMYAIVKNNIGVCLVELGDIDGAKEQFRESIEFIPDGYNYPDPYKNLESIS